MIKIFNNRAVGVPPVLFLKLALTLAAAFGQSLGPTPGTDDSGFSGEYGLWVQTSSEHTEVHWVTATTDSGFLEVIVAGDTVQRFVTPRSLSHRVVFDTPNALSLTLLYGGYKKENDRHTTVVNLSLKRPKAVWSKIDSVYVLGDIHGEFEQLAELLQNAGVVDANLDWAGRRKHVVFLGDLFDRGPHVTRTLWLLYKLEWQAERDGGRVHIVLGNHEIMTFGNDLRYLSPQERMLSHLHGVGYAELFDVHRSLLGNWLADKPGIIKINKALLAHGGVSLDYAGYRIAAFNDSLRKFLHEDTFAYLLQDSTDGIQLDTLSLFRRQHFFYGASSVFWYRDYVRRSDLSQALNAVLRQYRCKTHVVAHTPVRSIAALYRGKLLAVDLRKPATEMLLLLRKGKHRRFRIKQDGAVERLE